MMTPTKTTTTKLCVSLQGSSASMLEALRSLDPASEMAEIRCDLIDERPLATEVVARLFSSAKSRGVETIATCRELKGGEGFTEERAAILEAGMANGATYVDVELEAPSEYKNRLKESARKHGVKVVISMHEYAKTEESSMNLKRVVDECFAQGADVAKVAVAVVSARGAARVLSLYDDARPVVALGMGEDGKITRLGAAFLNAPFTFVCMDRASATAPGQMSREMMGSLVRSLREGDSPSPAKKIKV